MRKIREELILEFLAWESLNLEVWLQRYEDLKLGGLFCEKKNLGLGNFIELFFKNQWSGYKISDRRLIFQKSRVLFARFLNWTKIMNYFSKGNPVDWVQGWWTPCGLPWTSGGTDRRKLGHGGVLIGVWLSATPEHVSSPARVPKRDGSIGHASRGSGGGVATGRRWRSYGRGETPWW
jgi:hypothetical protein